MLETYKPSVRFLAPALVRLAVAAVLAAALAPPYQRIIDWLSQNPLRERGTTLHLFAVAFAVGTAPTDAERVRWYAGNRV